VENAVVFPPGFSESEIDSEPQSAFFAGFRRKKAQNLPQNRKIPQNICKKMTAICKKSASPAGLHFFA
jgi:hypothetical protein